MDIASIGNSKKLLIKSQLRPRPLISVIVVNWNGQAFLQECLEALVGQTYDKFEIIFVDNGSTDASVDFVSQNFPQIAILALSENYGFAGGNIKGLEVSNGEYIALLNNDTCVDQKWLDNLGQPMRVDSSVGICASKLLMDSTGKINSAGDGITTAGVGCNRGLGNDRMLYERQEAVFGACGGAVLYRRAMLEEIGFLDNDFFLYDEDTDLNFRAQLAGWKCIYVPNACVYHKVNGTTGRLSDLHVYYHTRNLEFVWIKDMPTGLMLRFVHHKLIQELGSFCYLCLRHGKWKAFFQGKKDAIRMLPVMLRKRREIQKKKRVTNQYIQSFLLPYFNKRFIRQKIAQFIDG